MSIIRVSHQKNYVVINKIALEDPNLSFKSKGLWAYCMSRPDDWEFYVSHLATVSQDGEDAIYSAIKELIKFGYCQKKQVNEGGKFGKLEYIIFETPQIQKILPQPDFPDAGRSHANEPALPSIDCIPSIEEEVVCPNVAFAPSVSKKVEKFNSKGEKVILSQEDVFAYSCNKRPDWTTEEILEAWIVLVECNGPINSVYRFIEGTIDKKRNLKKFNKSQKFTQCKTMNTKDAESKKLEESSSSTISARDISKPPSQILKDFVDKMPMVRKF